MLKIALCDDDASFLDVFSFKLAQLFEDAGQPVKVSVFSSGKTLIEKVEKERQCFDVYFLDVDMPEIPGFKVAQRLRELNKSGILLFTTYLEQQSREGYLYGAFRYIFKSNLEHELPEAVSGILKLRGNLVADQESVTFKCRASGVIEEVTLKKADILYLKKERTRRVTLQSVHAQYELLVKPLSEYAELLDSPLFGLILRSYLLNFNHVESISADSFMLAGGLSVPLGIKREARKVSMEKYLKFLEERA